MSIPQAMRWNNYTLGLSVGTVSLLILMRLCFFERKMCPHPRQMHQSAGDRSTVTREATTPITTVDILDNRDIKYKDLIECQYDRRKTLESACEKRYRKTSLIDHRESLLYQLAQMMVIHKQRILLKVMPHVDQKPWQAMVFDNIFSSRHWKLRKHNQINYVAIPQLHRDFSLEVALAYMKKYHAVLVVMHPLRKLESLYEKGSYPEEKKRFRPKMMQMMKRMNEQRWKKKRKEMEQQRERRKNMPFVDFISDVVEYNRGPGRDAMWGSYDVISSCALSYKYIAKEESLLEDIEFINSQLLGNITSTEATQVQSRSSTSMKLNHFSEVSRASKTSLLKHLTEMYADDMAMFGYSYYIDGSGDVYATCKAANSKTCC